MKYNDQRLRALHLLLASLIAATALPVAQAADVIPPGAGAILQQIQPFTPRPPSPSGAGLVIEQIDGTRMPPSEPFDVKSLLISGNTVFDTPTLQALVADAPGQKLTLPQLGELVARITRYYQSHGYPLARAIIPAQTIALGAVHIEVIEARYGQITLDNQSRVSDSLLLATLAPLQSGQFIAQSKVDPVLLLLSDIPGILVGATLKPGETVGTADLLMGATPGPASSGHVVLDGYGNRYTGRRRLGATVNFNNPLHQGDVLTFSGLSSGSAMNYARVGYDALLNGQGTHLGGAWSALHYVLGDTLTSLNAHGTAYVASLWAKHPLVRGRDANLSAQIQYDGLQLRDHIDASGFQTDRSLQNWTLSLVGDTRDALLSGGLNSWSLGWTAGRIDFDNAAAQLADVATARTQGNFSKWNASLARLQRSGPMGTLYLAFSGQWASANLDSSQKMSAGGPNSVRAYDTGALSGDNGYFVSVEYRHELGAAWGGQWTAVVFADSANVTVNQNLWISGDNSATLSGTGLGLNWSGPNQWSARTYIAAPAGPPPALVGSTNSTRAWVEANWRF